MADDADPPRRFFQLKPKAFEAVNDVPAAPAPPAPDPDPAGRAANPPAPAGRIDVRDLFAAATTPGPLLGGSRSTAKNEVHAMLSENHARAEAAGLNAVTVRARRPSRRKRDFWLLLVGGNAVLAVGMVLQPIIAIAGVVLYNVSLLWIMWFVMDDY